MANEGNGAGAWDWGEHFNVQDRVLGPELNSYYAWHYPPFFMFIAAALAMLPYAARIADLAGQHPGRLCL